MAKGTAIITPVETVEQTGITLDLTMAEADVLREIFAKIGGDPDGRRRLVENMCRALEAGGANYEFRAHDLEPPVGSSSINCIYFYKV